LLSVIINQLYFRIQDTRTIYFWSYKEAKPFQLLILLYTNFTVWTLNISCSLVDPLTRISHFVYFNSLTIVWLCFVHVQILNRKKPISRWPSGPNIIRIRNHLKKINHFRYWIYTVLFTYVIIGLMIHSKCIWLSSYPESSVSKSTFL
jgi:hypothetical protein